VKRIVFDFLKEKGVIDSIKNEFGKISLEVVNDGIIIAGNRLELIELADYILDVALADFDGYHSHLDDIYFFDKADKQLIVELKLGKS